MPKEARIKNIKEIAKGTFEVTLGLDGDFHFEAGQYIRLIVPKLLSDDPRGRIRDFSIVSSPGTVSELGIAFRATGSGFKETILKLPLGTMVTLDGPFGDFLLPKDADTPIVFVAGGIGITPFLSMVRFATEHQLPHKIILLYINTAPESAAYLEELETLEKQNPNFVLKKKFGSLDRAFVDSAAADALGSLWYVAGPSGMLSVAKTLLKEKRIPEKSIRFEEFSGYVLSETAHSALMPFFEENSASGISALFKALNKSVIVSETDKQGNIIYANDKFIEISQYSREELIGQNHRILKSGFHPDSFYKDMWETIAQGKVWRGEIKNKAKDGSFYWVDSVLAPIVDGRGEIQQYIGIRFIITKQKETERSLELKVGEAREARTAVINLIEDIEEEKQKAEEMIRVRTRELREEKARLLASIESLSFGFIIADVDDKVLVKNAAISTILELTEEPTSVRDIVDSFKGVSAGLDVLVHSCRECVDLRKVVELKELSHGKKYLRVFCTPILTKSEDPQDTQDKVIGYAMLVEDITEAKIMERSRDEFFAVASHELRTPLTAIRGNADMILEMYADKIVDKDMKEMLQDIDTSSVRLINIVNDFLEVSSLEQGKIEIKKENFNVSDVVEKVVRDLKSMVEQKGLSIAYTPSASPLPTVFADKQRTEQILINLVGNAVKFTKEGGIIITASVADSFVGIRVIDTGSGISEHNQALLFRKFQQAGEQMLARDVTQSTGLGLYISKLIISSMGGTIGIEKSELGKGSTFAFTLPISK